MKQSGADGLAVVAVVVLVSAARRAPAAMA